MTKISSKEFLFWNIVKGEDFITIASRFSISIEKVRDRLATAKVNYPGLVAKFKRWGDIPRPSIGVSFESDFMKSNDLSFCEQLIAAGVDRGRVALANENFKQK